MNPRHSNFSTLITATVFAVALSLLHVPNVFAGLASDAPGVVSVGAGGVGMVSRDAEAVSFGGATASGTGQVATVSSAVVPFEILADVRRIGYTWFKESLKAAMSKYIDLRSLIKLRPEIEKTNAIIATQQREQLIDMWYEELRTRPIDDVIREIRATNYLLGLSTRELKMLLKERAEKAGIEVN